MTRSGHSRDQGQVGAQLTLALLHSIGDGAPHDRTEASNWYRQAAEQGDAKAQCILGFLYACGCGVTQNYWGAAKWCRLAANQGQVSAQYNLGGDFRTVDEVNRDIVENRKVGNLLLNAPMSG